MKRASVILVLILAAVTAGVVVSSSPTQASGTDCLLSNRASWIWSDCNYGTLIQVTGRSWTCNKSLDLYGTPPIRVEVLEGQTTPAQWSNSNAGKIILTNGCTEPAADYAAGKIDLIGYTDGLGLAIDPYGNGQDALKYNGDVGPQNMLWTVSAQCGARSPGAHQDGLQMQSGNHVTLVNGEIGHWDTGAATCAGAGGATFYSHVDNQFTTHYPGPGVDIIGGHFIACGKGLYGGWDTDHGGGFPVGWSTGTVDGASYHTGGALFDHSEDPNCGGIFHTTPCASGNTVTALNLTCIDSSGSPPPPPDDTAPTVTCNPVNQPTSPADQVLEATSANGAVASWTCSATDPDDAAGPVICSPASGDTFPIGTTDVNCQSTDQHSNTGYATFQIFVRDTTPPTVPTGLTVACVGSGICTWKFSWNASTDAVGVAGYRVYIDGVLKTTTTSLFYNFTYPGHGSHTFKTEAFDTAGNANSSTLTKTI